MLPDNAQKHIAASPELDRPPCSTILARRQVYLSLRLHDSIVLRRQHAIKSSATARQGSIHTQMLHMTDARNNLNYF